MADTHNNDECTENNLSVDDILSDPELSSLLAEEKPQEPQNETAEPAKKKQTGKRIVYYCLLTVFVGTFLFSAGYLGWYMIQSTTTANIYSQEADNVNSIRESVLASIAEEASNPNATGPDTQTEPSEETNEGGILPEYRDVAAKNEDMVGWLRIEGANVDYPVTQSPYEANYYLTHDFTKKENRFGCIYARENCNVFTPTDNVILYGHHMADGSMFGSLEKYEDKSFWEDHQYIQFDTLYERHTYQIIAVGKTSANVGQGFPYYEFINANSEAEFNNYISGVKGVSFYNTGLSAEYGDMLLTLITCEYTLENGRMIILAKRVA